MNRATRPWSCAALFGLALILLLPASPVAAGQNEVRRVNGQGNQLYTDEQWAEALAAYTAAGEIDPENAVLHYNLGNALYRLNDLDKAETHYRKAAAGDDQELARRARFNLGNTDFRRAETLEGAGDWQGRNQALVKAIENWKSVLETDSENRDAKLNLELARKKLLEKPPENEQQQQQDQQDQEQNEDQQQEQDQQEQDKQEQEQDEQKDQGEDQESDSGEEQQDPQDQQDQQDQQEQQAEAQPQDGEEQDQQEQDKQEQEQDEQKDQGEDQESDSGEEQQDPPDQQDQQEQQAEAQPQDGEEQEQAGEEQMEEMRISPEEAQRILDALRDEELEEQRRQMAERKGRGGSAERDW